MSREDLFVGNPSGQHGEGEESDEWNIEASVGLKNLLMRNKVSTTRLVERLSAMGVDVTLRGFQARLRRGTFSYAFYLQCERAIKARKATDSAEAKVGSEEGADSLN